MARILLNDLRKSYAGQQVIHGITMDIPNGEFVVIVGPSGCGKSTLLRMVAGLESISSGTIEINDKVVNDLEPRQRDIAMVFQNYALYPHMSVRENMAYGLKIAKLPKAEIDKSVARVAAMLELEPYLDRKPRALSGGSASGLQWAGPSSESRLPFFWTNRFRTLTPSCGFRCVCKSRSCICALARRPSM